MGNYVDRFILEAGTPFEVLKECKAGNSHSFVVGEWLFLFGIIRKQK